MYLARIDPWDPEKPCYNSHSLPNWVSSSVSVAANATIYRLILGRQYIDITVETPGRIFRWDYRS